MNKNRHKSFIHLLCLVFVLSGTGIPDLAQAQWSLPKLPPNITIRWLDSLTVDPTPVALGVATSINATLALLRPAANSMEVKLELSGASPLRGNPGMQVADCVSTFRLVYVTPDNIGRSFPIIIGSRQTRVGTPPTLVPKIFTITARYGSESVSATFTVNCPQ